jgi:peptide-methionine (R)-S-oxide reductase
MERRSFLTLCSSVCGLLIVTPKAFANSIIKINQPDSYWKEKLTDMQYKVLRNEDTERAFSSDLNNEKRAGLFVCAGCELPLFKSEFKYESGTGWPSFYDYIKENIETKRDFKLIFPRTEYHCAKCGGHQGHMFNDGPQPTGLRYCNNGVALKFIANEDA